MTGFKTVNTQWVPETTGTATLSFDVFDRGDTIFDSAALVDAAAVGQDPPLYFLRRGDSLVRTGADPLLRLNNATQTFDSLMVVCCDGRATLGGPLLHATDSNLTVPWSLLAVMQGGVLTTSSTDPLARFDGGVYTFGGAGVPMFDLYGTTAAVDRGDRPHPRDPPPPAARGLAPGRLQCHHRPPFRPCAWTTRCSRPARRSSCSATAAR